MNNLASSDWSKNCYGNKKCVNETLIHHFIFYYGYNFTLHLSEQPMSKIYLILKFFPVKHEATFMFILKYETPQP